MPTIAILFVKYVDKFNYRVGRIVMLKGFI